MILRDFSVLLALLGFSVSVKAEKADISSSQASFQLCSIVDQQSGESLSTLNTDGTLGSSIKLTEDAISGVFAGNASSGRYFYSPPFAQQNTDGLFEINTATKTVIKYKLESPNGYSGDYTITSLQASENEGDVVALLTENYNAWYAIAELTPSDGVPRVRANLTAYNFQSFDGAVYDSQTRSSWILAQTSAVGGFFKVPLDNPPPVLLNASLPDKFGLIGSTFCGRSIVVVGLVTEPNTYGLMALDANTLKWRNLITWSKDTFYLSGLGEMTCDPSGRIAYSVLSNATGNHVILGVDVITGKETSRLVMKDAGILVGSLAFCPSTF
jgi:hypothetical protein